MAKKRSWHELSRGGKAGVLGLVALQAVLAAFVQSDLSSRDQSQVRGPKVLWRALSFNTGGAVAYLVFGRR